MMFLCGFLPDWSNSISVWAFFIGIVSVVEEFFIYFQRTRKRILIYKMISDVIKVVQLSLTLAYTGAVLCLISLGREIVFYFKESKRWASHKVWLYVFVVLMFVAPLITPIINGTTQIFSLDWFVNFLPAIGSVIAVISFYKSDPHLVRLVGLAGTTLWWFYSMYAHLVYAPNIMQVIANTLAIFSTIYGLIMDRKMLKLAKIKTQPKAEQSTEQPSENTSL